MTALRWSPEPETDYEHREIPCPNCSRTDLKTCAHPDCEVYACTDHLTQCECGQRFCDEHITEYSGLMLCNAVCLAAEAEMVAA